MKIRPIGETPLSGLGLKPGMMTMLEREFPDPPDELTPWERELLDRVIDNMRDIVGIEEMIKGTTR